MPQLLHAGLQAARIVTKRKRPMALYELRTYTLPARPRALRAWRRNSRGETRGHSEPIAGFYMNPALRGKYCAQLPKSFVDISNIGKVCLLAPRGSSSPICASCMRMTLPIVWRKKQIARADLRVCMPVSRPRSILNRRKVREDQNSRAAQPINPGAGHPAAGVPWQRQPLTR